MCACGVLVNTSLSEKKKNRSTVTEGKPVFIAGKQWIQHSSESCERISVGLGQASLTNSGLQDNTLQLSATQLAEWVVVASLSRIGPSDT